MQELNSMYPDSKTELYKLLIEQLKALLIDEPYVIPNLSNASALLNGALRDINWVGFYLIHENNIHENNIHEKELLLGPFQGKPACIHIPIGRGVCGSAVAEKKTQLVADVHAFPGHIACDSASRSEIVIPLWSGDRIIGVLDIDSPIPARFDEEDRKGLEAFAHVLQEGCNW